MFCPEFTSTGYGRYETVLLLPIWDEFFNRICQIIVDVGSDEPAERILGSHRDALQRLILCQRDLLSTTIDVLSALPANTIPGVEQITPEYAKSHLTPVRAHIMSLGVDGCACVGFDFDCSDSNITIGVMSLRNKAMCAGAADLLWHKAAAQRVLSAPVEA